MAELGPHFLVRFYVRGTQPELSHRKTPLSSTHFYLCETSPIYVDYHITSAILYTPGLLNYL